MESTISKTVIINTIVTVLECSRSLHAHSVPRSRAAVPGKIRTKRLKLLKHLYVKKQSFNQKVSSSKVLQI